MSNKKSPVTRIKKLFNIDEEAKKCYPRDYVPYNAAHCILAFLPVKHHSPEPRGRGISVTFRQAA